MRERSCVTACETALFRGGAATVAGVLTARRITGRTAFVSACAATNTTPVSALVLLPLLFHNAGLVGNCEPRGVVATSTLPLRKLGGRCAGIPPAAGAAAAVDDGGVFGNMCRLRIRCFVAESWITSVTWSPAGTADRDEPPGVLHAPETTPAPPPLLTLMLLLSVLLFAIVRLAVRLAGTTGAIAKEGNGAAAGIGVVCSPRGGGAGASLTTSSRGFALKLSKRESAGVESFCTAALTASDWKGLGSSPGAMMVTAERRRPCRAVLASMLLLRLSMI